MKKSLSHLIIRFLTTLSLLGLVAALLLAYYYLPQRIVIHFNEFGNPDTFIPKEQFFYSLGIAAIIYNVILALLSNMIASVHPRFLVIPNRDFWMADKNSRKHFYEIYEDWFHSLAILLNIFLLICIATLIRSHRMDTMSVFNFSWLPLLGGFLLVVWIVFLPIRLRIKKAEIIS